MKNNVEHVSLQWDAEDFRAAYSSVCQQLKVTEENISKEQAIVELETFFKFHEEWLTETINDALWSWLYEKMKQ